MPDSLSTQSSSQLTNELFIMPFDHRGSFQEKLFGIRGRSPNPEETKRIAQTKQVIYEGYKKALTAGVSQKNSGILVDEQFGSEILKDAKLHGYTTSCPAEKSGLNEFDFEYGADFREHIKKFSPNYVKVLVRYNPSKAEGGSELNTEINERQALRLKELSLFCQSSSSKLMFELLVPATSAQLEKCGGETRIFDQELRPQLMIEAIKELQEAGVKPDLWKLEGVEKREYAKKIAEQARSNGQTQVGLILLGRGENAEKVREWLQLAASVPGFIGFAVGRTVFWEPIKAYTEERLSQEQASTEIAQRFKGLCDLWQAAAKG